MAARRRNRDTPRRAERSRVLLLVDVGGDRKVLASWLSVDHDVIEPGNDDPLGQEFDLCLLDDAAFLRVWQRIDGRKRQSEPVFLPFVLLTSRTTAHMVSDIPRHDIDEVLEAPVARDELLRRVDVLLERRARELVLDTERDLALSELREAQRQTARELETTQRLLEAANALSASIDVGEVLSSLVRILSEVTGRSRVLVMLYNEGDDELTLRAVSDAESLRVGTRVRLEDVPPPMRDSIANKSTIVIDVESPDMPEHFRTQLKRYGDGLALSAPLVFGGRTVGHIIIDDPGERRSFTQREIALAEAIASQAAIALENARLYAAEHEAARLGEALAEVDRIVHSSLEFKEVAKRALAAGAAAIGAETAAVDGTMEDRWEVWYDFGFEPSIVGRRFSEKEIPHGAFAVRTGQPVAIDDTQIDPRVNAGVMRAFGLRSCVVAPLIIRGSSIATLYFNYTSAPHRFTPAEVDFVRNVASSLSLAMENARLYEAERGIADRLQEALLALPDDVEGVRFSHAYHSATEAARVGGDFYDVFELDDRRVGIVIGDVAGKGLDAAVLTSVVKNTVRAHASERQKMPAEILRLTNDVIFKATPTESFVTIFFGILDLRSGFLLYANGGHTTAAITRAQGAASKLAVTGPLLGALPDVHISQERVRLGEAEVLFLYTDGLTEARSDGDLYGEERLLHFLSTTPSRTSLDIVHETIEEVLRFSGGQLRDDLAVLAVQRLPIAPESGAEDIGADQADRPSRRQVGVSAKAGGTGS